MAGATGSDAEPAGTPRSAHTIPSTVTSRVTEGVTGRLLSERSTSSHTLPVGPITTSTSDRLDQTSLPDSSSTIHWGPAITAPSFTHAHVTPTTSPENMSSRSSTGFSMGARNAIIAVTTIGKIWLVIPSSSALLICAKVAQSCCCFYYTRCGDDGKAIATQRSCISGDIQAL